MTVLIINCMLFNFRALFEKDDLTDIDHFYDEAYEIFLSVGPDLEMNEVARRLLRTSVDRTTECLNTVDRDPVAAVRLLQEGNDDLVKAYLITVNGLNRKDLAEMEDVPLMWFVHFLKRMKKIVRLLDPDLDEHAIHEVERKARNGGRLGIRGHGDQPSPLLTYGELMEELRTVDQMVDEQRQYLAEMSRPLDDQGKEKDVDNQLYILFDRAEEMFAIYNVSRLIFDSEVYMRHSDLMVEEGGDIGILKAVPELARRIIGSQERVSKSID